MSASEQNVILSEETYGADFPEGGIVEMYDERLRIRKNYGTYGEVEYLDGEHCNSRFYWEFQGDRAELISKGP